MKNIGGQALIEGIMMKSENLKSISIRKSNGQIITNTKKLKQSSLKKIPLIRGVYSLIISMIEASEDINYCASFFEEDEQKGRFEIFLEEKFNIKIDKIISIFSLIFSVFLAVFMFLFLPTFITKFFEKESGIIFSFVEGLIKISIFVLYISLISKLPDIKRVFMYHGAEHKSIFAYENNLELTVENVHKMPRLHPRCGTNFITITLIISIFINSFIQIEDISSRILFKLLLLPIVVGISYEIIKLAGKKQTLFTNTLIFPGMMLQKITTKEPEKEQIEVAIEALKKVL